MNLILFDNEFRNRFLPLAFTRPISEFRVGILTITEKWEKRLNTKASFITQDYLSDKYPLKIKEDNLLINGSVMPSDMLLKLVTQMEINEAYLQNDGELIAARLDNEQFENLMGDRDIDDLSAVELGETKFSKLNHLWDIFLLNEEQLSEDFQFLTKGRKSQPISSTNQVLNPENIFIEEGAEVEFSILNASAAPIYVGKNAKIMEGCMIRNGLALCEKAVLKMGAKIYGATTVGPGSKVGGEVGKSVVFANSNKGHEGYLGNSILGEWCNLGADTNTSNLKNNYGEVKLWDYDSERFQPTGQQFLGLVMGDHSKCGINTMFNTGTVVGVSANIYGSGYPRNFIPSFSWGGSGGYMTYRTDKAFETVEKVMERRKLSFELSERMALLRIFEDTARFRSWEKAESK